MIMYNSTRWLSHQKQTFPSTYIKLATTHCKLFNFLCLARGYHEGCTWKTFQGHNDAVTQAGIQSLVLKQCGIVSHHVMNEKLQCVWLIHCENTVWKYMNNAFFFFYMKDKNKVQWSDFSWLIQHVDRSLLART